MSENYYNMSIKKKKKDAFYWRKQISDDILISEDLLRLKIKALPIYNLYFIVERKYSVALLSFCRSDAPLWLQLLEYFINLSTA